MRTVTRFAAAVFVACALGCSGPEEHLIPAGTQGDVYILTGYRTGVPPKRDGSTRVFEIPRNRILVSQDVPSPGWHTTAFYYVDGAGRRTRLDYEPSTVPRTAATLADKRPFVWFMRTGQISAIDLPCPIQFMQYYVGTRADLLSRSTVEANAWEPEVENFVRTQRICP
jgi:hypothetical protein